MIAPVDHATRSARSDIPVMSVGEGRAFGGIVLAAFLLYGIGSPQNGRIMITLLKATGP